MTRTRGSMLLFRAREPFLMSMRVLTYRGRWERTVQGGKGELVHNGGRNTCCHSPRCPKVVICDQVFKGCLSILIPTMPQNLCLIPVSANMKMIRRRRAFGILAVSETMDGVGSSVHCWIAGQRLA